MGRSNHVEATGTREKIVLDALTNPMSCKELAEKIGISYFTLKPFLNQMVKKGLLKDSGFRIEGSIRYERADDSSLPVLQHFHSKAWVSPVDIVRHAVSQSNPADQSQSESNSVKAARALPLIMWQLVALARRLELGVGTQEEITALKAEVTELYRYASIPSSFYKQLLSNDDLWSAEAIQRMATDKYYPPDNELAEMQEFFKNWKV